MIVKENEELLIVDTESENKPFMRIYIFYKKENYAKTMSLSELKSFEYSCIDKEVEIYNLFNK